MVQDFYPETVGLNDLGNPSRVRLQMVAVSSCLVLIHKEIQILSVVQILKEHLAIVSQQQDLSMMPAISNSVK
jgi:hypothetical protein